MNKTLLLPIAALAALQIAVPASMIWARERTLREGTAFRFACEPVDPYDAFRGRYVRISVGAPSAPWTEPDPPRRESQEVYAALAVGEDGFARVAAVSPKPPATGAYVRARKLGRDPLSGEVFVRLPIERFYLPEHEAPAAERAYVERLAGEAREAAVVVRVRRGDLVVEDLLIEGAPIRTFLRMQAEAAAAADRE